MNATQHTLRLALGGALLCILTCCGNALLPEAKRRELYLSELRVMESGNQLVAGLAGVANALGSGTESAFTRGFAKEFVAQVQEVSKAAATMPIGELEAKIENLRTQQQTLNRLRESDRRR